MPDIAVTVALRPFKRRLQLEALTLTFLVVGCDSLSGARRNTFDTQDITNDVCVAEG
jgi:TctA family transporter